MSLLPYANGERKRADLKDNRGSKEPRGSVLDLRPLGTACVTTACLAPRPHRFKVAAAHRVRVTGGHSPGVPSIAAATTEE